MAYKALQLISIIIQFEYNSESKEIIENAYTFLGIFLSIIYLLLFSDNSLLF